MATRKQLADAWQGMDTVLCALDGTGPELPDKAVKKAMARALWLVLDWIVRKIDAEGRKNDDGL